MATRDLLYQGSYLLLFFVKRHWQDRLIRTLALKYISHHLNISYVICTEFRIQLKSDLKSHLCYTDRTLEATLCHLRNYTPD